MEYNITTFTDRLFELILGSELFPYGKNERVEEDKHPNRKPVHLQTAIMQNPNRLGFENIESFEIGNVNLEVNYPHYHILQNSPTIMKRSRGSTKSKGSEEGYKDKSKRDYERVMWNGKTFTKEYAKNVRGSRFPKATDYRYKGAVVINGKTYYTVANGDADSYVNIHYKYLDNICDTVVPLLAKEFGMTLRRKEDSGLIDEFADQEGVTIDQVLEAFDSFDL